MWRRALLALLLITTALPDQAKDDLIIGISQFPSSLHPDIDPEVVKGYALSFAIRPITAFDQNWRLVCLLCTEVPTLENGLARIEEHADGTRGIAVTIKLRTGLAWGDGAPVSAHDIAFTWKIARDPNSGFADPHAWGQVRSLDVVDDHTAVLHLDRAVYDYNRWGTILPEHIESAVYTRAKAPGEYMNQTTFNRAPTTPGLYNGPFLITSYRSGAEIVLEPNPHWAGKQPGLKRIVLRAIENTAALEANLLSGDVDMVAGEGIGLTIDQVIALRKRHPEAWTYIFKPSLAYEHIDLQSANPVLTDIRVRQALLFAIDRKTLTDKLFAGLQPVANSWVNPLDPNYTNDLPTYPFDSARARSLLTAAGWTPGSDGICRNAKGDRLTIELGTTAGNRLRELTEQVLQSEWRSACVEIMIKNEPARTFFGQTMKHRQFTGMAMYAWISAVDSSPRNTLASDQIPRSTNNWSGANYMAFSNPEMDADITRGEQELDPAKRKPIWADMQRIYAEQLPALPLFFRSEAHVIPSWLKGYAPTGTSSFGSLWAENWHPG